MPHIRRKSKVKKLRCFFGLHFPLHDALALLLDRLEEFAADPAGRLRPVSADNLHVTLKFLGAVPESELQIIREVASTVFTDQRSLSLECHGMGVFKNSAWVGIKDNLALAALARELDEACAPLGIKMEDKTFIPHATVARFQANARLKLSDLLTEFHETEWGRFEARQANLYRSDTLPEGARYSVIESFELAPVNTSGD